VIVNKYFLIFWLVIDYFPFSIYYRRTKETRGVKIDYCGFEFGCLLLEYYVFGAGDRLFVEERF